MNWVTVGILALTTSPIWGAFVWVIWDGFIKPRLIPAHEIDTLARDMLNRYGERAAEVAFIEEDRAWRYSNNYEQGKWRRVRRLILREGSHGNEDEELESER